MTIPPVSPVTYTSQSNYTIERVSRVAEGQYKISQMVYSITLYDHKGNIQTITNTNAISFLV